MMKKSETQEALLLVFCTLLLIGSMLSARFFRGDFTKAAFTHAPLESDTQGYVVEKDGLFLININRADKEMLMMLDGIGEVTAQRIIDYRSENGAFESVEELLDVKGIGEKTLEKMLPRIVCIPEDVPDRNSSFLEILGGMFD